MTLLFPVVVYLTRQFSIALIPALFRKISAVIATIVSGVKKPSKSTFGYFGAVACNFAASRLAVAASSGVAGFAEV